MTTEQVIRRARFHLDHAIQESSARFCLAESMQALDRDDLDAARMWAVKSLGYSVGAFSKDYQAAMH